MIIAFITCVYVIVALYVISNFKYDIQMLQQNSYRVERYWRWLKPDISSSWRLVDVALLFLCFSTLLNNALNFMIVAVVALGKIYLISRRKSKKPLVFTKRVIRIYSVAALLAMAAFGLTLAFFPGTETYSRYLLPLGVLLLCSIFSWMIVILAVEILTPVEKLINRRYYNDAKRILRGMPGLKIVGITGSYGKTSTKHFLTRILSEKYDVVMTPGSFNTPMGVIRTVREVMKPYNEVFVCEMGAKQKGDIKEICDLVEPQIGIVTAVGPMHLETFKSIENVQATKFELADALPADGLAVVNNDFEMCANRKVDNVKVERYGVSNPDGTSFRATSIRYTPDGTYFTVEGPAGLHLDLYTKLVGEGNISNLVAAVAVAWRLGVSADQIRHAVADIEQVEHRLSVKRAMGNYTIIDDAYNSNPSGSKMALDLLSHFSQARRIIITPGMIELGDRQYELNKEFGRHMAHCVDTAIIVGQLNRDAIISGLLEAGFDKKDIHAAATFNDAQQFLKSILKPGDTVLYENDLPDTFK